MACRPTPSCSRRCSRSGPTATPAELVVEPGDRGAAHRLVGKGVTARSFGALVTAPAVVRDAAGVTMLVAARLEGDLMAGFRRAALAYPMDTTVRVSVGIRNRSRVFGFGARNVVMQRNCCRACTGADEAPDAHAGIVGTAPALAALLRLHSPDIAARDAEVAEAFVLPDWRIAGTQWTSGVLNRTSPMPYHYDRNNLVPVWSAMVVARRGVEGGHLHIPELDVAVECRDGDVVIFPGWHFVHGVSPMRVVQEDAYRLTGVFYAVKGMAKCLEPEAEMARAREDRTRRDSDTRDADARLGPRR